MSETDKTVLYRSGIDKFVRQDFEGALRDFHQALEIDPPIRRRTPIRCPRLRKNG